MCPSADGKAAVYRGKEKAVLPHHTPSWTHHNPSWAASPCFYTYKVSTYIEYTLTYAAPQGEGKKNKKKTETETETETKLRNTYPPGLRSLKYVLVRTCVHRGDFPCVYI